MSSHTTTQGLVERERSLSAETAARMDRRQRITQSFGILIPFVVVLAVGLIFAPNFASGSNVTNMLVNAGILAVVGYGMTLVIALRGIDLSVGSTLALAAVVAAVAVNEWGGVVGTLAGIAMACVLGVINGFVITAFRVPAFIATLSTMSVFRGAVLLFTGGAPVMIDDAPFKAFATGTVAGIPIPFIVAVVLGFAMWFLLERMRYGRHAVAAGGNPEAAVDSGIRISTMQMIAYVIAAASAGVAGVLMASQLGTVNGSLGTGLELQVIAIVVLGGTSMAGGRGNIVGTFAAAVLLAMINSGLNLLNVASFYQYVALGALLIFALSLDGVQRQAIRRAMEGRLS